jgi:predicted nuclease with TOPRIM domain
VLYQFPSLQSSQILLPQLPPVDVATLPNEQKAEGEGLIEAIAEEVREKEEFIQRKQELSDKITSQQRDLTRLQDEVSSLEAKV